MKFKSYKILILFFLIFFNTANADILKVINVSGNERVNTETIKLFADVKLGENLSDKELNLILKNLYETGFFKNVNLEFLENKLTIIVEENPIITKINITGIKNKNFL